MDIVKRITTSLCGVAIVGILILGCENFDGPEPEPTYTTFSVISTPDLGSVPFCDPLYLEGCERLIIDNEYIAAFINTGLKNPVTGTDSIVMVPFGLSSVAKIIFQ